VLPLPFLSDSTMGTYTLKIREALDKSLHEMWRTKSRGGGGPCSALEFLYDLVETQIATFRDEQDKHQKPSKPEVVFKTGEDFRPMERKALSAENVQRALYLLDSGVAPRLVAERFGVSTPTIYRIQQQRAASEHVRIPGQRKAART